MIPDGPVTGWGVVQVRDAVRSGAVSWREVAAALLAAGNPGLRAFSEGPRMPEHDPVAGPLHGVPVAHKTWLSGTGLPEACAAAGAVDWGRTEATSPFGTDVATVNPRCPGRTPGFSSAGSAAAVAAGLVPGAWGTDTAGSVRIPAALCGVVGFRPSPERAPQVRLRSAAPSLEVPGPIARSVPDVAALWSAVVPGTRLEEERPLRVGYPAGLVHRWSDPDIGAEIDAAAALLVAGGHRVVAVEVPDPAETADLTAAVTAAGLDGVTDVAGAREGELDYARRRAADTATAATDRRRAALAARWRDVTAAVDAVLLPTVPIRAVARDVRTATWPGGASDPVTVVYPFWCRPASLAGLPALSVALPSGAGLQIVARPGADETVLALGACYERLRGPVGWVAA